MSTRRRLLPSTMGRRRQRPRPHASAATAMSSTCLPSVRSRPFSALALFLWSVVASATAEECCTLCLWCQDHATGGDDSSTRTSTSISGPSTSGLLELPTTFEGGNGQSGVMFDVENTSPTHSAILSDLVLHTSATREVTVEIYAKTGTYEGYERTPEKWDKIMQTTVVGRGEGNQTPLPTGAFSGTQGGTVGPIVVPPGRSAALYVTLTEYVRREVSLIYTDGKKGGSVVAESTDLTEAAAEGVNGGAGEVIEGGIRILEGCAIAYPFGEWWAPRAFNGIVVYEMVKEEETTTTESVPLVSSTQEPPPASTAFATNAPLQAVSTTSSTAAAPPPATISSTPAPPQAGGVVVAADLVLELSPVLPTSGAGSDQQGRAGVMDSDALLVFQSACQSFLGELFKYTLPPVGEIECRVRGQVVVASNDDDDDGGNGRKRRRLSGGKGHKRVDEEAAEETAKDAHAMAPYLRRDQGEDEDEDPAQGESSSPRALQIHLRLLGRIDDASSALAVNEDSRAPSNPAVASSSSSDPNAAAYAAADPTQSNESADFLDTAVDFFSVVSGQFLETLREVAEGTGVTYFDGMEEARVVTERDDGAGTRGDGTGEDKVPQGEDKDDGGGNAVNSASSTDGGGGLGKGIIIFIIVVAVNIALFAVAAVFLVRSRKGRSDNDTNNTEKSSRQKSEHRSTPPSSADGSSPRAGGSSGGPGRGGHGGPGTPSTPPLTPSDHFRDDDFRATGHAVVAPGVNPSPPSRGSSGHRPPVDLDDDSSLNTQHRPPLSVVPGELDDDNTFTSRLDGFDSVAGGAARERRREAAAAAAWQRMAETSSEAGIGIMEVTEVQRQTEAEAKKVKEKAKAVNVDSYMDGTVVSGGEDYRGSSLRDGMEGGGAGGSERRRTTPKQDLRASAAGAAPTLDPPEAASSGARREGYSEAAAAAAVAVDAYVEGESVVRYNGSTVVEQGGGGGQDMTYVGEESVGTDGRFNVSTVVGERSRVSWYGDGGGGGGGGGGVSDGRVSWYGDGAGGVSDGRFNVSPARNNRGVGEEEEEEGTNGGVNGDDDDAGTADGVRLDAAKTPRRNAPRDPPALEKGASLPTLASGSPPSPVTSPGGGGGGGGGASIVPYGSFDGDESRRDGALGRGGGSGGGKKKPVPWSPTELVDPARKSLVPYGELVRDPSSSSSAAAFASGIPPLSPTSTSATESNSSSSDSHQPPPPPLPPILPHPVEEDDGRAAAVHYDGEGEDDPSLCGASAGAMPSLAGNADDCTADYSYGGSTLGTFRSGYTPSKKAKATTTTTSTMSAMTPAFEQMTPPPHQSSSSIEPPLRTVYSSASSSSSRTSNGEKQRRQRQRQWQQQDDKNDEGKSAVTTSSDWFNRMISDAVERHDLDEEDGGSVIFDDSGKTAAEKAAAAADDARRGGGGGGARVSGPKETALDRRKRRMKAGGNGRNVKTGGGGGGAGAGGSGGRGLFRFGR